MYRRVRFVAGEDAGGRRSRGCGDDEDEVQRRIWPARRHDDFREGPLEGHRVIIEPNSPSVGVTVAFIAVNGAPVELMQIDHEVRPDL